MIVSKLHVLPKVNIFGPFFSAVREGCWGGVCGGGGVKGPALSCPVSWLFWIFGSLISSLCLLAPSFAVCSDPCWYEHISHSLSFFPSPSLPQDCCFIKQTLPIFHLPLSSYSPLSVSSLSVFYLFSLFHTHTLALHTSMHCSAEISLYTFTTVFSANQRKCDIEKLSPPLHIHSSLHLPLFAASALCAPSISLSLSLHLFQTQGSYI